MLLIVRRLNSIALEERRNVINEKLAKKERKKKKKKKEKKDKSSSGSGSNSTEPSYTSAMAESESMSPMYTIHSLNTSKKYFTNYILDLKTSRQNRMHTIQCLWIDEQILVASFNTLIIISGVISEIQSTNGDTGAEMLPSDRVLAMELEERRELEEKKRQRDPPVVFKEVVDPRVDFDALVGLVDGKLNEDEQKSLEELHQYVLEDEGSWALGDNFLNFIGSH